MAKKGIQVRTVPWRVLGVIESVEKVDDKAILSIKIPCPVGQECEVEKYEVTGGIVDLLVAVGYKDKMFECYPRPNGDFVTARVGGLHISEGHIAVAG